jgi:hypothetical protein
MYVVVQTCVDIGPDFKFQNILQSISDSKINHKKTESLSDPIIQYI